MNADIDRQLLQSIIDQYGIGYLTGEPVQILGDVDVNYKIVTEKGSYFLKNILNTKNLPQFEMLGDLHEFLLKNNIPVPRIFKTTSGKYIYSNFILYEFINGETQKSWDDEEIVSLTENFANLLQVLKTYPVPDFVKNKDDKYTRGYNMYYCHNEVRPRLEELPISEDLKNSIREVIDLLYGKLFEFGGLPKFLIHGDLNEMNAIFKDGKNIGIVDFGISYDPVVYDLGEYCYWFTMPNWSEDFDKRRFELIVKTFEKVLPLSDVERELLPYMVLRRGMMDLMLTLDYYWSSDTKVSLPEKRLRVLISRNKKIIELINSYGTQ